MKRNRILIAAGGTGGHIYPARAIAEYLYDKAEVLYLEKKIMSSPRNPLKLFIGFCQSIITILKFHPDIIYVTGGYPSVPIGLAAVLFRIPLVLQEQNAFLGKTNRLLARFARDIIYETPVRSEILNVRDKSPFEQRDTVLVFGGSQGARSINEAVEKMDLSGIKVVHLTGTHHSSLTTHHLNPQSEDSLYRKVEFTEDMASLYSKACLVVCRAGGSTLAELAVCGIPAVLIPYPYAAENHQQANAERYQKAEAAVICANLSPEGLESIMRSLYYDRKKLKSMSDNMRKIAGNGINEQIWERLKKSFSAFYWNRRLRDERNR
ncbi:MAG: UDP-N-acetylglucosamine--N-acetylmuramyl-(pentapeptide) pyrophosphoryl-undecaprenol N-acetylglucosamine transferase [Candidatus Margulisiibacteriota bacterium]